MVAINGQNGIKAFKTLEKNMPKVMKDTNAQNKLYAAYPETYTKALESINKHNDNVGRAFVNMQKIPTATPADFANKISSPTPEAYTKALDKINK